MRRGYDEIRRAEQLAVWTMRCLYRNHWLCLDRDSPARGGLLADLRSAVSALQEANQFMIVRQGSGLQIARHGDLCLTDDELHLLRGTAASQASAHRSVEIEMFELASNWAARQSLTLAVTLLGAALAAAGYWLPALQNTQPIHRPNSFC